MPLKATSYLTLDISPLFALFLLAGLFCQLLCWPVYLWGVSLWVCTLCLTTHTHKSLDTCIFDSCLRIINNFVLFIYLFVFEADSSEKCVSVCSWVRGQEEAIILLFKCTTLEIYIIFPHVSFPNFCLSDSQYVQYWNIWIIFATDASTLDPNHVTLHICNFVPGVV